MILKRILTLTDLYADEDTIREIVDRLSSEGHNITTAQKAGNAGLSDQEQLSYAHENNEPIITHNKIDFIKLHQSDQEHSGVFSVSRNMTNEQAAMRTHDAISKFPDMANTLVRVNKGEMIIDRHGEERETHQYCPEIRKQEYLDSVNLEQEIDMTHKDIERC